MMSYVLQPWHLLLSILAGWMNDEQRKWIEYLRTENQGVCRLGRAEGGSRSEAHPARAIDERIRNAVDQGSK